MKVQNQIKTTCYKSTDGFVNSYQKLIKDVVIPYQLEILNDRVEGAEKSHVVANFVNAGKALRGEDIGDGFYGMVFQDSDAAKWLEATAFALVQFPDSELEKQADELIDIIAAAQDNDGYLNTYYTIKDKDKRFTNLSEGHELYCSGHMMEAAVAYYEATGKKTLLDVMEKNAEHIYKHFITDKNEGFPGHPEVELALMKMYRATNNQHCLELAQHFIDVRGVDKHFYEKEKEKRDWTVWNNDVSNYDYQQSGKPVREQADATGHSVRAVYLYTGMADISSQADDKELFNACKRLWESITQKRMYVTGGIGSTVNGEAFTVDYDLPNDTAYAETCASIGLMFFASRMLECDVNSEYADIMERAFYNTVLAGMQLDGKRFFYVNPLEIVLGISGVASTHWHDRPSRPSWYTCACCPPNVARLISSLGKYAYGENEVACYCHLFAEGNVQFENGLAMKCTTAYPYGFTVDYDITAGEKTLAVRIPDWSENTSITLNGEKADCTYKKGYAYINVKQGDKITLTLDNSVKKIYCSDKVAENTGCVCLQRGPLVYCAEGADNKNVLGITIDENADITPIECDDVALGKTVMLSIEGHCTQTLGSLYSYTKPKISDCKVTCIPYYTWGNRGENNMRVWLPQA